MNEEIAMTNLQILSDANFKAGVKVKKLHRRGLDDALLSRLLTPRSIGMPLLSSQTPCIFWNQHNQGKLRFNACRVRSR
jgi:hypothetical protein